MMWPTFSQGGRQDASSPCALVLLVLFQRSQRRAQPPQHPWIARRGIGGFIGQRHQRCQAKAGRQSLEPPGGKMPVRITARPTEQVDLACGAFHEGDTQVGNQYVIVADGGGQGGVKGARIIGHGDQRYRACVKFW